MAQLSIAICDDNLLDLEEEYDIINSVLQGREFHYRIETFNNPQSLIDKDNSYDIVFLDVEMNTLNGIQTAEKLRGYNKDCLIFFVTNHEAYLDDALNQHAFRFWTKPIDKSKLIYGIKSALKEINNSRQYITVIIGREKKHILLKNIVYVYMENKRLHVVTTKADLITDDTYKKIYEQLKDVDFFGEPFRGYCVNFNYLTKYTHETLLCRAGEKYYKLDISRRKYYSFNNSFIDWISDK